MLSRMNRPIAIAWLALLAALLASCATQGDIDAWNSRNQPIQAGSEAKDSPGTGTGPRNLPPPRSHPATRNLGEVLAMSEADFDLPLALLLFSRDNGGKPDIDACLARLDKWGSTLRSRVASYRTPSHRLDLLRRYIHDELGFSYDSGDPRGLSTDNLFLDRVIARRKGYCVTLSVVYVIVGRAAGIDIAAVRLPGHFAAVSQETSPPTVIETTAEGRPRGRTELYTAYQMSVQSVEQNGVFLTPLTGREVVSTFYNNLGGVKVYAGAKAEALALFNKSVELSGTNIEARYNRAGLLAQDGSLEKTQSAMEDLNESIRMDPNFYHAWCRRAGLLYRHGERQKAAEQLAKAKRMRPDEPIAYLEEGVICYGEADYAAAKSAFEEALKRDPGNEDGLRNLAATEHALGNKARADELLKQADKQK